MKSEHIMEALTYVKEDYIAEAAPKQRRAKKIPVRWTAAAAALVILLAFFQTPPMVKAMEIVKERVTTFIETLFPPKETPVIVEGETEVIHQEAGGQEPEIQEDGAVTAPGFAIYYDTERYTMTEENGITYIRFNIENDLPPCEVEIRHIPDLLPEDAAEADRVGALESWDKVSEITVPDNPEGVYFHVSAGTSWDSACEDRYFLRDGRSGCFQITARYFREATEGHGVRFAQMIRTFEVIDP